MGWFRVRRGARSRLGVQQGVVANRRNPATSCRTDNAVRAVRVDRQCAVQGRSDELRRNGGSGVATFLATCVASATLLGAPLDASAVVGGKVRGETASRSCS